MNDIKVIVTASGKLICAERDKMLVFPNAGEETDNFLERAAQEFEVRARSYDPVLSLSI